MDIKKLSLDEKIGQMIMAGFPSKYCDDHFMRLVREYNVGNIDLFGRNIGSIRETVSLTHDIQENMIENMGIPAFIGMDQEGGMVSRIKEGAAFFPGNMAFGAANIKGGTFEEGRIIGEVLRNMGINLDIAPVLDVNCNPENPIIGTRSYGDNPLKVASLGVDFIKGIQSRNVLSAAKHFPGHGDTSADTHLSMPYISYGMDRLNKVELYPFRKAVNAGVDGIMTAHIVYTALEDKGLPATLSYNILTRLLREEMNFKGIIITDCMEMDAIARNYGIEKASVMAVKAGADMICISHHLDVQIKSIDAIKNAVLKGDIAEDRIDDSVQRIVDMKNKYNILKNPFPDIKKAEASLENSVYLNFSREISQKSITLVKDDNNLIPLKGDGIVSIAPEPLSLTGVEDEEKRKYAFSYAVKEKFGGKAFIIPLNPEMDLIQKISAECKDAFRVVIGTYNANSNPGQLELIDKIKKCNKNVIAVILRSPYDLLSIHGISTCVCTYEYTPNSVSSVLKVLDGEIKPSGNLPINIF